MTDGIEHAGTDCPVCPYCGHQYWDWDGDTDRDCIEECEACDAQFVVRGYTTTTWTTMKPDRSVDA